MNKEKLSEETYENMTKSSTSVPKALTLKKSPGCSGCIIPGFINPNCTAFLFKSGTERWLIKGTPEEAKQLLDKLEYMPLPYILRTIK